MNATAPSRASAAPHAAAAPRRPAAPATSPAAFLDALSTGKSDTDEPAEERQSDAAAGTPLPDANAASLAWLATMALPPAAATPAPAANDTGIPGGIGAPPSEASALDASPPAPTAGAPLRPDAALGAMFARDPALAAVHGPVTIELPATPAPAGRHAAPIAGAPMPTPAQALLATGTAAPAGQVFAAALHAAGREQKTPDTPEAASGTPSPAVAVAAADLAPHAVTGAGDASGGGALDMRDGRWPHAMMDRIERLRDEADAADTRIRLVPDQLGSIDVAVRREGDTLHVRFHAAEAATRTLLADAQPQLANIAEQRGMRLGDAQVGGGSGDTPRQPPRPAPQAPTRPAAATAAAAATPTDTRIA